MRLKDLIFISEICPFRDIFTYLWVEWNKDDKYSSGMFSFDRYDVYTDPIYYLRLLHYQRGNPKKYWLIKNMNRYQLIIWP